MSSKWNHVAMFCTRNNSTLVFESTLESGVTLNPTHRLSQILEARGTIGIRHLDLDPSFLADMEGGEEEVWRRLKEYVEEVGGLPYDRLLKNYLGRKGGKEGKEEKEKQQKFCSQLIAGSNSFFVFPSIPSLFI